MDPDSVFLTVFCWHWRCLSVDHAFSSKDLEDMYSLEVKPHKRSEKFLLYFCFIKDSIEIYTLKSNYDIQISFYLFFFFFFLELSDRNFQWPFWNKEVHFWINFYKLGPHIEWLTRKLTLQLFPKIFLIVNCIQPLGFLFPYNNQWCSLSIFSLFFFFSVFFLT